MILNELDTPFFCWFFYLHPSLLEGISRIPFPASTAFTRMLSPSFDKPTCMPWLKKTACSTLLLIVQTFGASSMTCLFHSTIVSSPDMLKMRHHPAAPAVNSGPHFADHISPPSSHPSSPARPQLTSPPSQSHPLCTVFDRRQPLLHPLGLV